MTLLELDNTGTCIVFLRVSTLQPRWLTFLCWRLTLYSQPRPSATILWLGAEKKSAKQLVGWRFFSVQPSIAGLMTRLNNQFCLKRPRFLFVSGLAGNRTRITTQGRSSTTRKVSHRARGWRPEKKLYKFQCKGD